MGLSSQVKYLRNDESPLLQILKRAVAVKENDSVESACPYFGCSENTSGTPGAL